MELKLAENGGIDDPITLKELASISITAALFILGFGLFYWEMFKEIAR